MKRIGIVLGLAVLVFVVFTWWALEAGGVAVVETTDEAGATRLTHVWFAERDGALWLEAGSPENAWYLDLRHDARIVLRADERVSVWRAVPVHDDAQRVALRVALRAKYGFRDVWVGMFVDSSRSVPVRLEAVEP